MSPFIPRPHVLRVAQDRAKEKDFARDTGIGTADYVVVHSAADDLEKALEQVSAARDP